MSRVPVSTQGWDCYTDLVDGDWVERAPRRPEVRAALEHEVRLMPLVAPLLPLSVPVPGVLPHGGDLPWRVRHRRIPGAPVSPATLSSRDGLRTGAFLHALHAIGFATYAAAGTSPESHRDASFDDLGAAVLPRLPRDLLDSGEALLVRARASLPTALVHGDLGPDHLLATGCCVTGVIDWADARLDDPAVDLAWVLHGTPAEFADAVAARYQPGAALLERSRDRHALGPWHEVRHGLQTDQAAYVDAGMVGALERLHWLEAG